MRPFWHPLSTLFMAEPRCYANSAMIRMMLAGEGGAELIYGGDRMWPAVTHDQPVRVEPCTAERVGVGEVVVVEHDRIPELLRVVRIIGQGRLYLRGDADPLDAVEVGRDALLGKAALDAAAVTQAGRFLRVLRADLLEALRHSPDEPENGDPARTVRDKYDAQAPYYASREDDMVTEAMLRRIRHLLPPPATVLVVGSGSGRECIQLRSCGYRVKGIDFSAAMTSEARRGAQNRNLDIEFIEADIRKHSEPPSSLGGIFFTYDTYSFLPREASRTALLRNMAAWLAPGGTIFLSARLVCGLYDHMILSIQRMRSGMSGFAEWGDSHTRYLTSDGALHRSFVHCFTLQSLRREAGAAGLTIRPLPEGHFALKRKSEDGTA